MSRAFTHPSTLIKQSAFQKIIQITLCEMIVAILAWASCAAVALAIEQYPLYTETNPPHLHVGSDSQNLDTVYQVPASQPPPSKKGNWLGWGGDIYNNHWASSDAVVDTSNAGSLVPVCQKAYDPGVSAAPLVEDGVAYYPTWNGLLVALDYKSCHTLWKTNISTLIRDFKGGSKQQLAFILGSGAALASRTTPVVDGDVLFIGTLARALVVALDKRTGRHIDILQIGSHPLSILSQSPTFYQGRLFIGISTSESGAPSFDPNYKCCSHHGSMNAVALRHGRLSLLWTTHTIPPGANFSGASVWGSQPAIDPIRQQVLIGTGELFSLPPEFEACQDATTNLAVTRENLANEPCLPLNVYLNSVLALDIVTGKINWARTLGPLDAWNAACVPNLIPGNPPDMPPGPSCPKHIGKDADFGMAPTFVLGSEFTPDGKDVVVAGQKNGNLYAFSAQAGTIMWATSASPGGLEGGLSWGIAVDDRAVYYTGTNFDRVNITLPNGTTISNSAFGAASLKDGSVLWKTKAPRNTASQVVPVVVNDVLLNGVTGDWTESSARPVGPGSFLAMNKLTGEILHETPLDSYFHAGIAVVHDYVMFGTGYGGIEPAAKGSFNVWRLKPADNDDTKVPLIKQDKKMVELERKRIELRKKIEELEREEDNLGSSRDEL
ncbi:Quino protein alcohol dehydrogenase-like protein [Melanomma pulvis-pyrius CBS 109.77]|uniref:Quino protein alcohol dehydrogenase-like protein n=1 Tax=Melanomma pulvis-pyrius CBS 109.77 TaxID=1314802 RepID=A0A6A6XTM4_9PLEO|nr:Quino protein alcohol dehydrogenase-like protein [Melanomma pulvis-pyrius CBS 109.77]